MNPENTFTNPYDTHTNHTSQTINHSRYNYNQFAEADYPFSFNPMSYSPYGQGETQQLFSYSQNGTTSVSTIGDQTATIPWSFSSNTSAKTTPSQESEKAPHMDNEFIIPSSYMHSLDTTIPTRNVNEEEEKPSSENGPTTDSFKVLYETSKSSDPPIASDWHSQTMSFSSTVQTTSTSSPTKATNNILQVKAGERPQQDPITYTIPNTTRQQQQQQKQEHDNSPTVWERIQSHVYPTYSISFLVIIMLLIVFIAVCLRPPFLYVYTSSKARSFSVIRLCLLCGIILACLVGFPYAAHHIQTKMPTD